MTYNASATILLPSSGTDMEKRTVNTNLYAFLCINLAVIEGVHVICYVIISDMAQHKCTCNTYVTKVCSRCHIPIGHDVITQLAHSKYH